MTYRAPDPQRTTESAEEGARREEAERAAIAAMKDPFARFASRFVRPSRRASSASAARIMGAAALLLPTATLVVAAIFHDTRFAQKLPGAVLAEGLFTGVGAIALGAVALRVVPFEERGWVVVAIVCGVVALPWTLACAFFTLLAGGGMLLR